MANGSLEGGGSESSEIVRRQQSGDSGGGIGGAAGAGGGQPTGRPRGDIDIGEIARAGRGRRRRPQAGQIGGVATGGGSTQPPEDEAMGGAAAGGGQPGAGRDRSVGDAAAGGGEPPAQPDTARGQQSPSMTRRSGQSTRPPRGQGQQGSTGMGRGAGQTDRAPEPRGERRPEPSATREAARRGALGPSRQERQREVLGRVRRRETAEVRDRLQSGFEGALSPTESALVFRQFSGRVRRLEATAEPGTEAFTSELERSLERRLSGPAGRVDVDIDPETGRLQGIERREEFGDADLSLGLFGPGDEVEAAAEDITAFGRRTVPGAFQPFEEAAGRLETVDTSLPIAQGLNPEFATGVVQTLEQGALGLFAAPELGVEATETGVFFARTGVERRIEAAQGIGSGPKAEQLQSAFLATAPPGVAAATSPEAARFKTVAEETTAAAVEEGVEFAQERPRAAFGALTTAAAGELAASAAAARVPVSVARFDVPVDGGEQTLRGLRVGTDITGRRTVFGLQGRRPRLGPPEFDLDRAQLSGLRPEGQKGDVFEPVTGFETEVTSRTVLRQGSPEAAARFRAIEELLGEAEAGVLSGRAGQTRAVEEVVAEVPGIPEERAAAVTEALAEADATIFGSGAVRAQTTAFRAPRDIDFITPDKPRAKERLAEALEGTDVPVTGKGSPFDIKEPGQFAGLEAGEPFGFGRVSRDPIETESGVRINPIEEELQRKAGASGFLRAGSVKFTGEGVDIGPRPVRTGKPPRSKDVTDTADIADALLGPTSPATRRFRRAFDAGETLPEPQPATGLFQRETAAFRRFLAEERGQADLGLRPAVRARQDLLDVPDRPRARRTTGIDTDDTPRARSGDREPGSPSAAPSPSAGGRSAIPGLFGSSLLGGLATGDASQPPVSAVPPASPPAAPPPASPASMRDPLASPASQPAAGTSSPTAPPPSPSLAVSPPASPSPSPTITPPAPLAASPGVLAFTASSPAQPGRRTDFEGDLTGDETAFTTPGEFETAFEFGVASPETVLDAGTTPGGDSF